MLIRRVARPHPLFDPRWRYTIDIDFYFRCLGENDAVLDRRVLCCFRVSPRQLSAVLARSQAKELRSSLWSWRFATPMMCPIPMSGSAWRGQSCSPAGRRTLYWQIRMRSLIASIRKPKTTGHGPPMVCMGHETHYQSHRSTTTPASNGLEEESRSH